MVRVLGSAVVLALAWLASAGERTGAPTQAPPAPPAWQLEWSQDFDGPAGQAVDTARWKTEIGDGSSRGIPGWGNRELQYYTDHAENASLDGQGHLVITAAKADGSLACYYGPCRYTSARLVSRDAIGPGHRIEARLRVPEGRGLWPAFWALGTDVAEVSWPACGEIDVMEYVGRNPHEVFGALHGPGYSGAAGRSSRHQLPAPLPTDFHVFAVDWTRDGIDWMVDGRRYHRVTPADLQGRPWVFDKPFTLILNLAVGGLLGGEVGPEVTFPRHLIVDSIRVSRAAVPEGPV